MSTSDDPKEPYFFSVLPWIVLYRIIKHEEAFDCLLQQHMLVRDDEGLSDVLIARAFDGSALRVETLRLPFR